MQGLDQHFDHVVWDWNGTLLDDTALCIRLTNTLLEEHGLPPLTLERYLNLFDFPVRDYYQAIGFDFNRESFESLGARWMQAYDENRFDCTLHEGILDTMTAVQAAGLEQSILSAYEQERLERIVDHFGLRPMFRHVIGRSDPWADGKELLARQWLDASGAEPARVLMIGDTVHDHEISKAIGIQCILVARGHQSAARLEACGAPVLRHIEELPAWLETLGT